MAADERVQLVPKMHVTVISTYVISAADPDVKRAFEVGLFECPGCEGTIGVDMSYVSNVTDSIACPYCRDLLMITEG